MKKKWIIAAVCVLAVFVLAGAFVLKHAFDTTDIPKLYLEGDISGMESKEDEREIAFRYDDGESSWHCYPPRVQPSLEARACKPIADSVELDAGTEEHQCCR